MYTSCVNYSGMIIEANSELQTIKGLMTRKEVAELLCISEIALEARRKRGQLPYVKVSKENIRFNPSEIASLFGLEEEMQSISTPPALMTVKEAASFLAVTEETVRGLLKKHKIKKTKISAHTIRIKGTQILNFIKNNSVRAFGTSHKSRTSA